MWRGTEGAKESGENPPRLTVAVVLGQVGCQRGLCLFAPASLFGGREGEAVKGCRSRSGRGEGDMGRPRLTLASAPALGLRGSVGHQHALREVRPLPICKQRAAEPWLGGMLGGDARGAPAGQGVAHPLADR